MSFNEVKELRKAGKLEEALELANQNLEADPDNIWNKRSVAWVYYEYIKSNADIATYVTFLDNLRKLVALNLPTDEKMVFESVSFQLGKLNFSNQKQLPPDYTKTGELFDIVKQFHVSKSSDAYIFIYKSFHKGYKDWPRYIEFADWWDFANFREDEYKKETMPNGKQIMALVEQAYIGYSKKLLEGSFTEEDSFNKTIDTEKIKTFLLKLDQIIESHPEYQYPSYFKAKLLLALGNKEDVLSAFLPFAKKKQNDFWVWELMSEVFEKNDARNIACLCKALSLKSPEDFLIKTREKLASSLVDKKLYDEAKTEILKIIQTRSKNEWKIPSHIALWKDAEWFNSATDLKNNREFYNKHVTIAEEILFSDIEEEVVAVEFVNKNRSILNFVKDKTKNGFFNYSQHLENPKIGSLLNVRFSDEGQDGFFKALSCELAEGSTSSPALKEFDGTIKIRDSNTFGFVEDIFIDPQVVKENKFKDGQQVKGKKILSYNKKKEVWGWKMI